MPDICFNCSDKISLTSLFPSEVSWSARQRCAAQRRAVLSPAPCHAVEMSSHLYVSFYHKNIWAPFSSVGSGNALKSTNVGGQASYLCKPTYMSCYVSSLMSYGSVDSERPTLSRTASSHAGRQDTDDVCRLTEIIHIGTLLLSRGYKI